MILGSLSAALALVALPASAAAQANCTIELRPAAKPTSVGEDFDAVKRVGQDLRDYSQAAGKPLDWLTPERQIELIRQLPVATLLGMPGATVVADPAPVSRSDALAAAATAPEGCVTKVMIPQAILERGGLAQRSLRIFGVVRRYQDGAQLSSFSGFSAGPMIGFRLRSPEDLPAATSLVEAAYKSAVEKLLQSSAKPKGK